MNVFYHCYGGAHSSVLAASLHCGYLPMDHLPTNEEIMGLRHYDESVTADVGRMRWIGQDECHHDIYCVGFGSEKEISLRALCGYLDMQMIDPHDYLFVNVFNLVTLTTKFGGALSRRFGLVLPGRTLTVWGLKRRYWQFVALVRDVKHYVNHERRYDVAGIWPLRGEPYRLR